MPVVENTGSRSQKQTFLPSLFDLAIWFGQCIILQSYLGIKTKKYYFNFYTNPLV